MFYTKEVINKIKNQRKDELYKTKFVVYANGCSKQGKFVSVNKKILKIKNKQGFIYSIPMSSIRNISFVVYHDEI